IENVSLWRWVCADASTPMVSSAKATKDLGLIMLNIEYLLDHIRSRSATCSLLRRFCRANSLWSVVRLRQRWQGGFDVHIHQQVDATLQLKELRHRKGRKRFVELLEILLLQLSQTRVARKHFFCHRFGLGVGQRRVLLGVLLDDGHTIIIQPGSFVLVLLIDRPERRAIFVVEIHSGCDERGPVCLHIGPHYCDSGVDTGLLYLYGRCLILGTAQRAKSEHRERSHN